MEKRKKKPKIDAAERVFKTALSKRLEQLPHGSRAVAADHVGRHPNTLSNWADTEKRGTPTIYEVKRIAERLGLSPAWLAFGLEPQALGGWQQLNQFAQAFDAAGPELRDAALRVLNPPGPPQQNAEEPSSTTRTAAKAQPPDTSRGKTGPLQFICEMIKDRLSDPLTYQALTAEDLSACDELYMLVHARYKTPGPPATTDTRSFDARDAGSGKAPEASSPNPSSPHDADERQTNIAG